MSIFHKFSIRMCKDCCDYGPPKFRRIEQIHSSGDSNNNYRKNYYHICVYILSIKMDMTFSQTDEKISGAWQLLSK